VECVAGDHDTHVQQLKRKLKEGEERTLRRRIQDDNTRSDSRLVQWAHSFRQPAHGDQQSELFTGPTIPDCSDDNVPNSHCCRSRTTFWISKDEPSTDEEKEDPRGNQKYWFGYQGVTKCREICEQQHLRTGHDTQCLPVTEECNNWEGLDGNAFTYSCSKRRTVCAG
jgi:hypothetical protein